MIEGNDAIVKTASGLRFGAFDKDTGEIHPSTGHFVDYKYRVGDMTMITIEGSTNVVIRNLELDGNLSSLILGGMWGDTGRQIQANGLKIRGSSYVHLDNVNAHHHAPDVTNTWYINVNNPHIAAEPPTLVDGPHVRWGS